MHKLCIALLCGTLALVSATAEAQTNVRVRGTITAFDGKELAVKSLEGKDLQVELAENATVSYPKALTFADLQPGVGLGTTATQRPDGTLVALEVHVFPPGARGLQPRAPTFGLAARGDDDERDSVYHG